MKEILLTQGKVALVDDEDYERLSQYKWSAYKHRHTFYATRRNGKGSHIKMHRDILGLKNGDGNITDHKDRDGLNNRRNNLRLTGSSLNSYNRQCNINNTSGFRGIWKNGKYNWVASIGADGIDHYLGVFPNKILAAAAYDHAANKYFGNNAILNFPKETL